MIINKFDIKCVERKAIKGQVIIAQLEDAPIINDYPLILESLDESILATSPLRLWQLYFNKSFTQHGAGARILLVTPQGDCIPKTYRLSFPCTNNIVKYKKLTIGLQIVIQWRIQELCVFGDSQLVFWQINNDY